MYKDILVPVDLGAKESWEKALPVAVEMCQAFGAVLHVMTVVPDFGMTLVAQYFPRDFEEKAIENATESLHAFTAEHIPKDVEIQHIVAHGVIYEEIMRVADEIDAGLILMGSHRPKFADHLIGPNAQRVVSHTNRSVLVVR